MLHKPFYKIYIKLEQRSMHIRSSFRRLTVLIDMVGTLPGSINE